MPCIRSRFTIYASFLRGRGGGEREFHTVNKYRKYRRRSRANVFPPRHTLLHVRNVGNVDGSATTWPMTSHGSCGYLTLLFSIIWSISARPSGARQWTGFRVFCARLRVLCRINRLGPSRAGGGGGDGQNCPSAHYGCGDVNTTWHDTQHALKVTRCYTRGDTCMQFFARFPPEA